MPLNTIYTLERTNEPALKFLGTLIGEASSGAERAASDYSGQVGRYQEIELYKTVGGKYVISIANCTLWDGEDDEHIAEVCETEDEIYNFLGYGKMAQELYADAGLEPCELVD